MYMGVPPQEQAFGTGPPSVSCSPKRAYIGLVPKLFSSALWSWGPMLCTSWVLQAA